LFASECEILTIIKIEGTTHIKIIKVIETVTRSTDIGTTITFTTLKDCGCCSPENNLSCCISRG